MKKMIITFNLLILSTSTALANCGNIAAKFKKSNTFYYCTDNCTNFRNYKLAKQNNTKLKKGNMNFIYTTPQGHSSNGVVSVNITKSNSKNAGKVKVFRNKIDFSCSKGLEKVDAETSKFSKDGLKYEAFDEYHRTITSKQNDEFKFLKDDFHIRYKKSDKHFFCSGHTDADGNRQRFLFENRNSKTSLFDMASGRIGLNSNSATAEEITKSVSKSREVVMLGYKRASKSYSCVSFNTNKEEGQLLITIDDLNTEIENKDFDSVRKKHTYLFD